MEPEGFTSSVRPLRSNQNKTNVPHNKPPRTKERSVASRERRKHASKERRKGKRLALKMRAKTDPTLREKLQKKKRKRVTTDEKVRQKYDIPAAATIIYTDGACAENGKRFAKAGVGVFFVKDDERNISAPLPGIKQSSPRAELFAVLKALETIHFNSKLSGQGTKEVCILTDSKYVLDGLTKWCLAWEKNGWTTLEGNPVCSEDLFKRARGMMRSLGDCGTNVNIKYVPGHRGIQGNEEADKLAKWGVMMSQHTNENFDCEGLDELIATIDWT